MKKVFTIGRDANCDIIIPDTTDVVSRLHATLRVDGSKIFLTDQSLNGTYINGLKMSSNVEIPVSRKDVISFAHVYDLDWNLIPRKNWNALLGIGLLSILAICVLVGIANFFFNHRQLENPVPVTPEASPLRPVVVTDTIIKKDTVVVQPKEIKKEKKVVPNKDSVKAEKPSEEPVYNPIY